MHTTRERWVSKVTPLHHSGVPVRYPMIRAWIITVDWWHGRGWIIIIILIINIITIAIIIVLVIITTITITSVTIASVYMPKYSPSHQSPSLQSTSPSHQSPSLQSTSPPSPPSPSHQSPSLQSTCQNIRHHISHHRFSLHHHHISHHRFSLHAKIFATVNRINIVSSSSPHTHKEINRFWSMDTLIPTGWSVLMKIWWAQWK